MKHPGPVCPLCGGELTPCFVIATGQVKECHGARKDVLGTSIHRSPVESRVCVECGYILLFAQKPEVFRQELPSGRGVLPIPVEPEPGPERLPIPAGGEHSGGDSPGKQDEG